MAMTKRAIVSFNLKAVQEYSDSEFFSVSPATVRFKQ